MTSHTTPNLPDRVYGDWTWNTDTNRPDHIYPARIRSQWSGGVEFLTDRATAERIVTDQTNLRASLREPEDVDALWFDGDTLVYHGVDDTEYRYDPDAEGLYDCGFGWTWMPWTDEDEEEHPDPANATHCDNCGKPYWLGLDFQRRVQDGETFICEDCVDRTTLHDNEREIAKRIHADLAALRDSLDTEHVDDGLWAALDRVVTTWETFEEEAGIQS